MRCVLAIDSGGTKCETLLVHEDGTVLGHGYCDFRDPESGRGYSGSGRSARSIQAATLQALGGYQCREIHLAVFAQAISKRARPFLHEIPVMVHLVTEENAALAAAGEDTGVVVLAGTGAVVYGHTRDDRELRLDGMGPMVGDYGSGYHVGLLAVRAAARAKWHPRHQTSLANSVIEEIKKYSGSDQTLSKLFIGQTPDRSIIASLARLVDQEAEAGDALARKLLEIAAGAIAETVRDLVDGLEIADEEYPMVATGSVATKSRIYWEHLSKLVHEFAPKFRPVVPALPQVAGMALLTLRDISPTGVDTVSETFLRSAGEVFRSLVGTQ